MVDLGIAYNFLRILSSLVVHLEVQIFVQRVSHVQTTYCHKLSFLNVIEQIRTIGNSLFSSEGRDIFDIIIHSKYFPVSDWLKPHA